jgi:hypothetical protein
MEQEFLGGRMKKFVVCFFPWSNQTFEDLEVEADYFTADSDNIKFMKNSVYGPVASVPRDNVRYVRYVEESVG